MNYIEMTLSEALTQKWAAGQRQYGTTFVGHPIEEWFEECLDSIHYCDKAVEIGFDVGHHRSRLVAMALELQTLWRNRDERKIVADRISFCECALCNELRTSSEDKAASDDGRD